MIRQWLAVTVAALPLSRSAVAQTPPAWKTAKTETVGGMSVSISEPVLVARSKGRLWFPTITRMTGGKVLAIMSAAPDVAGVKPGKHVSWSADGGLSWSGIVATPEIHGGGMIRLTDDHYMVLPFNLTVAENGAIGAPFALVSPKNAGVRQGNEDLTVTGWPRPLSGDGKPGIAPVSFNRQTIEMTGGGYLGTLYGRFKGAKRESLMLAQSPDAKRWSVRGIVADEDCNVPGREGPNEAALCRLKDGRLMCIFRVDSGAKYGQSWSDDDGKTWTPPVAMRDAFSVQPYLAVMGNGAVVLAGGRPGLWLWVNADGSGKDWQPIDLQAVHNQCQPTETITKAMTTAYLHLTPIDDRHLLCVYDRVPFGWGTVPGKSEETNSVWVFRLAIDAK